MNRDLHENKRENEWRYTIPAFEDIMLVWSVFDKGKYIVKQCHSEVYALCIVKSRHKYKTANENYIFARHLFIQSLIYRLLSFSGTLLFQAF